MRASNFLTGTQDVQLPVLLLCKVQTDSERAALLVPPARLELAITHLKRVVLYHSATEAILVLSAGFEPASHA